LVADLSILAEESLAVTLSYVYASEQTISFIAYCVIINWIITINELRE